MRRLSSVVVLAGLAAVVAACSNDNTSTPPTPVQTITLEAEKLAAAPDANFWANADFAEFTASSTSGDGSVGQSYAGEYNMTGSKLGLSVPIRMKAAYTATDLYILAQWDDPSATNDLNRRRWFFNGDVASVLQIGRASCRERV